MKLDRELLEELAILSLFNEHTVQEGIKVHSHQASKQDVMATKRLFDKGVLSQADGGYLTNLGKEAIEHFHGLAHLINPAKI
jgi:uncharacterized protein (TIGR02647 family)